MNNLIITMNREFKHLQSISLWNKRTKMKERVGVFSAFYSNRKDVISSMGQIYFIPCKLYNHILKSKLFFYTMTLVIS